ncbi:hypothetical protein GH714_012345 [Hevea brasiliensis]|uniref:Leucine-rich repeat-containing N-terminal plant-type domain-containing protein n=1 Tax=Hevea brasiliensis TaxID=3981 RepID=A0A6A6MXQ4_HEVBR|nr:hypothetical protein GH714_012345 [Hevea brasiliensis]
MILLLQGSWCSDGCLEHERIALLQLKFEFISPSWGISYDSFDYDMPLWGVNADCCNWGGVKCNTTTGHVVELTLDGFERLSVLDNLELLELSFNYFNNNILSSLSGLSSLKFLYLRANRLKGIINIEGGEELLKLSNLQYLDLGYNNFSINNLSFLNGLSSLKGLNIANSQLNGQFDLKDLGLSQLEELNLSENNITKFVDSRGLPHLKDLEYLELDESIINNNILQSIGVMSSLKKLSLRSCKLNDKVFKPRCVQTKTTPRFRHFL